MPLSHVLQLGETSSSCLGYCIRREPWKRTSVIVAASFSTPFSEPQSRIELSKGRPGEVGVPDANSLGRMSLDFSLGLVS